MNRSRLVFVTRRFWPLMNEPELTIGRMASSLVDRGVPTTLITRRWEKKWSDHFFYRDMPVERLGFAPYGRIGDFRHLRNLVRWLKQYRTTYDAVVCVGINEDAVATCKISALSGKPVLIYHLSNGLMNDWTSVELNAERLQRLTSRNGSRPFCVMVPGQASRNEVLSLGFDEDAVERVSLGIDQPALPNTDNRANLRGNARAALAQAHQIFAIDPLEPLVYYAGPFDKEARIIELIDAWNLVRPRFPRGKLWLVGELPEQQKIWDRIVYHGLVNEVILVGAFDDLHEINMAANLAVFPGTPSDENPIQLGAMSCGLPVVAMKNHQDDTERPTYQLFTNHQPETMAGAIVRALEEDQPELVARAADVVAAQNSMNEALDRIDDCLKRLTSQVTN